jgi:LAO/AO transport system kinase
LHLFAAADSGWVAPVEICSSLTGDGLEKIWQHMLDFEQSTRDSGYFMAQRQQQRLEWLHESLQEAVQVAIAERFGADLQQAESAVLAGEIVPSIAAREFIERFFHQQ